MEENHNEKITRQNWRKFLIPSLLGTILFLTPISYQGTTTLIVGIIVDIIEEILGQSLVVIMTLLIVSSSAISLIHALKPMRFIKKTPELSAMFETTKFWLSIRVLGAIMAPLILFHIGPTWLHSDTTGGNILFVLLPACGVWFVASGLLLPLLTDYGAMDFIGAIFQRFSRVLFRLPGRALMDCFASWVGSGVCGTMLTINQYNKGYYTAREASIIVTNFSVIGIGFTVAMLQYIQIEALFVPFYISVIAVGFVCSIITPRIWPLNKVVDQYDEQAGKQIHEDAPQNTSTLRWGIQAAIKRAKTSPSVGTFFKNGIANTLSIITNTCPVLVALGTICLIVAEYTSFFEIISYPFVALLNLLQVPEATSAAPALIVGFADQFLPFIVASGVTEIYTKFVIGVVAVLQIIYITEIGAMILTSRIPLGIGKLFVIFLERTIISLPLVVFMANILAV